MRKGIFHDHKAHSIYDKGTLNCFSFGGSNATNTKKKGSRITREIFDSNEFGVAFYGDGKGHGQVSSHSVQKCAVTHACCNVSP